MVGWLFNGIVCLDMLENCFNSIRLKTKDVPFFCRALYVPYMTAIFAEDGTMPNLLTEVWDFLNMWLLSICVDWVYRYNMCQYVTPCSPDLKPMDLLILGFTKDQVYAPPYQTICRSYAQLVETSLTKKLSFGGCLQDDQWQSRRT